MTRVATAPELQQPGPIVVEARAPAPMATAPADTVVVAMPQTALAAPQSSSMSNNMMSERAPRADRN